MVSKSDSKVSINVNGAEKAIFSIKLSNSGSLFIILKTASQYKYIKSAYEQYKSLDSIEITAEKYSIHPSRHLPEENYIHHKLYLRGQSEKIESSQYTRAIKSGERFAFLFTKRSPDLSSERYVVASNSSRTHSIGSYDPKIGVLFYSVLVACCDLKFPIIEDPDSSIRVWQRNFGDFNLIVLYSFLYITSDHTGTLSHFGTLRPAGLESPIKEFVQEIIDGFTSSSAIGLCTANFIQLADEMAESISERFPSDSEESIVIENADFYSEADRSSRFYAAHKRKIREALLKRAMGFTPFTQNR